MYTPIVATLGYVMSSNKRETLLVHRNRRAHDAHYGKYNGLGGKMEANESIYQCLCRELFEEAGITCEQAILRGTINWTGFGPHGEDWFGFIYRVERFSGIPCAANDEGELVWYPVDKVLQLPLWEGDRYFLPMVFDDHPLPFHGYMPYRGDKPVSWTYHRA